jgi:hypothetical protein
VGNPRAGGGVGCRRSFKRDCRGIVRAQRIRHEQVRHLKPHSLSISSSNRPEPQPEKSGAGQGRCPKGKETRKKKKQTQRKRSGSAWPPGLVADWAACFSITSPAVSIFITTAAQQDHQSACMMDGMGWDARRLSCCAGGFGISLRRDAPVPVTECWPARCDDDPRSCRLVGIVDGSGEGVACSLMMISRRLLNAEKTWHRVVSQPWPYSKRQFVENSEGIER